MPFPANFRVAFVHYGKKQKRPQVFTLAAFVFYAPGRIRTYNLRIRSQDVIFLTSDTGMVCVAGFWLLTNS